MVFALLMNANVARCQTCTQTDTTVIAIEGTSIPGTGNTLESFVAGGVRINTARRVAFADPDAVYAFEMSTSTLSELARTGNDAPGSFLSGCDEPFEVCELTSFGPFGISGFLVTGISTAGAIQFEAQLVGLSSEACGGVTEGIFINSQGANSLLYAPQVASCNSPGFYTAGIPTPMMTLSGDSLFIRGKAVGGCDDPAVHTNIVFDTGESDCTLAVENAAAPGGGYYIPVSSSSHCADENTVFTSLGFRGRTFVAGIVDEQSSCLPPTTYRLVLGTSVVAEHGMDIPIGVPGARLPEFSTQSQPGDSTWASDVGQLSALGARCRVCI